MCTYLTHDLPAEGSVLAGGSWLDVHRLVVSFDHPQEARAEHALCIDFRAGDDPSAHVLVELDPDSARTLALRVLATLDAREVVELLPAAQG